MYRIEFEVLKETSDSRYHCRLDEENVCDIKTWQGEKRIRRQNNNIFLRMIPYDEFRKKGACSFQEYLA